MGMSARWNNALLGVAVKKMKIGQMKPVPVDESGILMDGGLTES